MKCPYCSSSITSSQKLEVYKEDGTEVDKMWLYTCTTCSIQFARQWVEVAKRRII